MESTKEKQQADGCRPLPWAYSSSTNRAVSTKDVLGIAAHFERMLYDNALLSRVYLHAYQASGDPFFLCVVEETLDYILREMTSPEGGFYSTQDANSEGEEGKFFVWIPDEVDALMGQTDSPLFRAYFDVTEAGNFEHKNILHVDHSLEEMTAWLSVTPEQLAEVIERRKRILFEAREKRSLIIWPQSITDKAIPSGNAVAASVLFVGGSLSRASWMRYWDEADSLATQPCYYRLPEAARSCIRARRCAR